MRTSGSLRVILNTPVYRGMSVENPTERTVRLTGYAASGDGGEGSGTGTGAGIGLGGGGEVKVFLVTASPKDAGALFRALSERVRALNEEEDEEKEEEEEEEESPSSSSPKKRKGE